MWGVGREAEAAGSTSLSIPVHGAFPSADVGLAAPWLSSFPDALNLGHPRQKQGGHAHRASHPLTRLPWLSGTP